MKCKDCMQFVEGQCFLAEKPSEVENPECLQRLIIVGLHNIFDVLVEIAENKNIT